jgi:ankyrin repeat protein
MLARVQANCGVDALIEAKSLLYWAALFGNPYSVRWLLEAGANPNRAFESGATPLHAAAESRSVDCCRILIEHGVTVDVMDDEGRTPLLCAIENSNIRNAELLLEHGASVGVRDKSGRGPIEYLEGHVSAREFREVFERTGVK